MNIPPSGSRRFVWNPPENFKEASTQHGWGEGAERAAEAKKLRRIDNENTCVVLKSRRKRYVKKTVKNIYFGLFRYIINKK